MIRKKAAAKSVKVKAPRSPVFTKDSFPEPGTITKNIPKDLLCHYLQQIADKRKMAETIANRYKTNARLRNDFSFEEVKGELHTTICYVLNAWQCYWDKKQGKRSLLPPSAIVNLAATTRLRTFGELTGYFVNAYKNNISKKYNKYKTYKRAAPKSMIYLDSTTEGEEHQKHMAEGLIAVNPHQQLEFNQAMDFLVEHLQVFDREENERQRLLYEPASVPMKKQSHLAPLFQALLDDQYHGNKDQIRIHFKWTDYIFKRNQELLVKKLKTNFAELGRDMLQYIIEDQADLVGEAKPDKEEESKRPKNLEIHQVFGMKTIPGKTPTQTRQKFTLTISIDSLEAGKWVPLKTVKQREIEVKLNTLSFAEAKAKLSATKDADEKEALKLLAQLKATA